MLFEERSTFPQMGLVFILLLLIALVFATVVVSPSRHLSHRVFEERGHFTAWVSLKVCGPALQTFECQRPDGIILVAYCPGTDTECALGLFRPSGNTAVGITAFVASCKKVSKLLEEYKCQPKNLTLQFP